jgi:hypothetical protein
MSRGVLTLLGMGLLITGVGVAAAGVERPESEADLRAEVRRLKSQIEKLEARLAAIESKSAQAGPVLNFTPAERKFVLPEVPLSFAPSHLPPNAERREFNGAPYYIIPIQDTAANVAPGLAAP